MFTPGNLLLTTIIVLLLVGTKKIRHAGEDIGMAIKNFREAMQGKTEKKEPADELEANDKEKF